jgi:hypothetical protein
LFSTPVTLPAPGRSRQWITPALTL